MTDTLKMVKAFFESRDLKCRVPEEDDNVLLISFRGDNIESVQVILYFSENGEYVTFRSYNVCKFPEGKVNAMYKLCSELNKEYKWAKFFVDEQDNTITVQADAIVQLDSCGPECEELVMRLVSIIDEAYPEMMKAIWA